MNHLAPFKILKPKPGVCQQCAVDHDPQIPHDRQSLTYQYSFYAQHGRWPTWVDAMAHCPEEVKREWLSALRAAGVEV